MSEPAQARIDLVLSALGSAIASAIASQGIPGGKVFVGWPDPSALRALPQSDGFLVSIFPQPSSRRVANRAGLSFRRFTLPTVTLAATTSGHALTFSGALGTYNVHCLFGHPTQDALYQTTATDTLASTAAGLAAAINARAGSSLVTVSGATITFPASTAFKVNIGGAGTIVGEVDRVERRVQVSVWAPTGDNASSPLLGLRSSVADAIASNVGTLTSPWLDLGDKTSARVCFVGDQFIDNSQSDLDMYEYHLFYTVEYGVMQTIQATQVGAIVQTETLNTNGQTLVSTQG